MLRLRRDLGPTSTLGMAYTDRIDGDDYNRVLGVDAHVVWRKVWFSEVQVAGSWTRGQGAARAGKLWTVTFGDRTGRAYGNHYELLGVQRSFQDTSGFVNRTDFVAGRTFNRFSFYGRPGALVEQFTAIVGFAPIWRYRDFGRLNRTIEDTLQTFWIATLRGGWQSQVTLSLNHFGFDGADYSGYTVGSTPFVVPHAGAAPRGALGASAPHPRARPQPVLDREHPAAQARVPADARDLRALHRTVLRGGPGRAARPAHGAATSRERRHRARDRDERLPERPVVFLQADAGDRRVPGLRRVAHRGGRLPVPEPEPRLGRVFPQAELPLPHVALYPSPPLRAIFSSMPDAADLTQQLADEDRAKQRRYVLANARARWRFVALGAALLAILRVARVAPVSWLFILGFAGVFAGVSYAMVRLVRGGEFRAWHAQADIALSAAMISAILYAVGPSGHLLYVVYLIAPLQVALYLGQTDAWQALLVNLTGFGLATAVRVSQGTPGWTWSAFA